MENMVWNTPGDTPAIVAFKQCSARFESYPCNDPKTLPTVQTIHASTVESCVAHLAAPRGCQWKYELRGPLELHASSPLVACHELGPVVFGLAHVNGSTVCLAFKYQNGYSAFRQPWDDSCTALSGVASTAGFPYGSDAACSSLVAPDEAPDEDGRLPLALWLFTYPELSPIETTVAVDLQYLLMPFALVVGMVGQFFFVLFSPLFFLFEALVIVAECTHIYCV